MTTKQAAKQINREIEQAYYRLAQSQQIGIMYIPKVFSESRRAIATGATVDQAVRATVLMYCEVN